MKTIYENRLLSVRIEEDNPGIVFVHTAGKEQLYVMVCAVPNGLMVQIPQESKMEQLSKTQLIIEEK
ncbi:MAG: hypothetical protein A3D44_03685 [Candidatus Staskawiczbacteria bacterium RIFCSPHIGHO2_02_FULL_42_22]|uniref:Uncharacterized protein n=1 Tax=Candidatus Staskawiczbacteria bacterium RIFCSPHIGHO2_02_FULL_42_22 TaxID=1802207 RepID=A0A1G2I4Z3_9BACT|nr:MAG: hypothetical protein A3D44_03685 [Candidatus Staskawiczbacteria bacterium RIFCSPHIGHO2_02_FULL_42_22]